MDHSNWFTIAFAFTIVLPFVLSVGDGGKISKHAYFGRMYDHDMYPHARWMIKTRICLFENIPQTILILYEIFHLRQTITTF